MQPNLGLCVGPGFGSAVCQAEVPRRRRWIQHPFVHILNRDAQLLNGELEIDNEKANWRSFSVIKNQIRPVALGRNNYLFAGSHAAAKRAALVYSLLGTCKLHIIDPYKWLKDVLERIQYLPINRIEELLPQNCSPQD